MQRVILVVKLDDRARQDRAFLDAELRRNGAGGNIAHDDLERNDLYFLDQLLAHVQTLNKMGRDAHFVEIDENVLGYAVVQHAFAVNDFVLFRIESGRIVFEKLYQRAGFGALIKDFALAP